MLSVCLVRLLFPFDQVDKGNRLPHMVMVAIRLLSRVFLLKFSVVFSPLCLLFCFKYFAGNFRRSYRH